MNKAILLLSAVLFLSIISASALAGEVITITDVVNVDGKIGLYIRNEVGLTMRTDNSDYNISVLDYFIGDTRLLSIPAESVDKIPTDEIKLVVLDRAWPTTNYATVKVVFIDQTGLNYNPEHGYAFAKTGLTLIESWTDPKLITSNSSFTIFLKMKASGEGNITQIDETYVVNPKYYLYVSHSTRPLSLKQGETGTYSFTYKLSGMAVPDTIDYETVYVPAQFTYMYLNRSAKTLVNESVIIYNRVKISSLPEMKSVIDIPNTIILGKTLDVPVYVWNTKSGSHPACNLNLTLKEGSGELELPISNILPSDKTFPPATEQSSEPTATFKLTIPEAVSEGDYTLTLSGKYRDCDWKAPGSFEHTKQFSVVKKTVIADEPVETIGLPEEKITGIGVEKEKSELPVSKLKNYLIGGALLLAIIIGVVFLLEKRGRHI